MVKHTERIRRLLSTSSLSVFEHFVGLAAKGLMKQINPLHATSAFLCPLGINLLRFEMSCMKWVNVIITNTLNNLNE